MFALSFFQKTVTRAFSHQRVFLAAFVVAVAFGVAHPVSAQCIISDASCQSYTDDCPANQICVPDAGGNACLAIPDPAGCNVGVGFVCDPDVLNPVVPGQVIPFFPGVAPAGAMPCSFFGGQLRITLPNGNVVDVAGYPATPVVPFVDGTIPAGESFGPFNYTVAAADADPPNTVGGDLDFLVDYGKTANFLAQTPGVVLGITAECGNASGTCDRSLGLCEVELDKQISCDGGATFVDVTGADDNNPDNPANAFGCNGWNAFNNNAPENIIVRYVIQNNSSAGTTLTGCVLTDSNSGILGGVGLPIADLAIGASDTIDINVPCSDALDAMEPDTATIVCEAHGANGQGDDVMDSDTADFECLTPALQVTKVCDDPDPATGLNAITVTVCNTGNNAHCVGANDPDDCCTGDGTGTCVGNGADLANCVATDEIFLDDPDCPGDIGVGTAVPLSPPGAFNIPAGGPCVVLTGSVGPLNADAANEAWVTCDIVGSAPPDGDPKTITDHDCDECTCTLGDLWIEKVDQDGNTQNGVGFNVTGPSGFDMDCTTGPNDTPADCHFLGIQSGIYTVTEPSPPAGFCFVGCTAVDAAGNNVPDASGDPGFQVNLLCGDMITVTCVNEELPDLWLKKVDQDGNTQDGVVFNVSGPDPDNSDCAAGGNPVGNCTTGVPDAGSGMCHFENIRAGCYTVSEPNPPAGFCFVGCTAVKNGNPVADADPAVPGFQICLAPGDMATVTCTNEELPDLWLRKVDQDGNTQDGVVFNVSGPDPDNSQCDTGGNPVGNCTTGVPNAGSGMCHFENIRAGCYSITEPTPPPGFEFVGCTAVDASGANVADASADPGFQLCLDPGDMVTVTCVNREVAEGEGCTPGYWKLIERDRGNAHHECNWADPYDPDDLFEETCADCGGETCFADVFCNLSLIQVLDKKKCGGNSGSFRNFGFHTVAALLNAASPDVNFGLSVCEVIEGFNAAVADGSNSAIQAQKNIFASFNECGSEDCEEDDPHCCPLGNCRCSEGGEVCCPGCEGADDGCGDGETCGGRNQGDSDCCEAHDGSGCDDNQCQDQVCGELESCCDHTDADGNFVAGVWDAACAAKTFEICCAFLCEDDAPPAPCVPTGGDNDDCANSQTICDGCTPFSTDGNTTDGLEHDCIPAGAAQQSYNDEWYSYIATCTGDLTVSTCNDADYDTILAAYDGCVGDFACPPGDPELLGCNDDGFGCGGFTSELTVPVTAGSCYTIRVGGFGDGETGSGNLCLACGAPGSNSRTSSPGTDGGQQTVSTGGTKGQESGATNTSGSASCGMLGFSMLAFLFASIVGLRLNRSRLSGVRKP